MENQSAKSLSRYRAIYAAMFDTAQQRHSQGNHGAIRKLRHRGKPRRPKCYVSNRGKIPISHELSERPVAANERVRFGDWQRGTNENTNGLLREYFPKGYDFSKLRDEDLQAVVEQLNHRPRKCLGYKTPREVYFFIMLHLA